MSEGTVPVSAHEPCCRLLRNDTGLITDVDESIVDVLGWRPEEMIGSPSTAFLHPDDHASAVAAWFEMVRAPGSTRVWRVRYRAADGGWRWVESVNSNHLHDPHSPVVLSMIRRVDEGPISLEEELRARKEVLSRLAEALPVGVFQIDVDRHVTFTNERLHEILDVPPAPDVASQFAVVVDEDRDVLDSALRAALGAEPVDDLELRYNVSVPHPDFAPTRVCQVSLRPLTDGGGAVAGAIGCLSDVTDSVELRRELQLRATVDGLTGCLNRTATFELLDVVLRHPSTAAAGIAVVFVDLDRFKAVNDRFGHAAGDRALAVAAERIRQAVRSCDSVGRIGGDEFLVICPDVRSKAAALPVARRVSDSLHTTLDLFGDRIELRASVGVAWTHRGSGSADKLVARADAAMYESKQGAAGAVTLAN